MITALCDEISVQPVLQFAQLSSARESAYEPAFRALQAKLRVASRPSPIVCLRPGVAARHAAPVHGVAKRSHELFWSISRSPPA